MLFGNKICIHYLVTQVLRDGEWQEQDAAVLVPGDIISIKLGDIIPADARLLDGDPLKIDQVVDPLCSIIMWPMSLICSCLIGLC